MEPSAGAILMGEEDLAKLRGSALRGARRRIGMVFQEYNLVERLTVMENVLTGRLGYVPLWRAWLRKYPRNPISTAPLPCSMRSACPTRPRAAPMRSPAGSASVGIARALMQSPCCWPMSPPPRSTPRPPSK